MMASGTNVKPFQAERAGIAPFVFAIFGPRDAGAAAVDSEEVQLFFGNRTLAVPLRQLEEIKVTEGLFWSHLRLRWSSGSAKISGLPRKAATALANAVEITRDDWWRRVLDSLIDTLKPVHNRIAALSNPPMYITAAEMRELEVEAGSVASQVAGRWPSTLSSAPEIQMLRDILAFLESPGEARKMANNAYIESELSRSRELLDTIESRPLTDEQRKAVVIDERRNLVIAAAGSGKTSVIVAKAGWLLHKGYRTPNELLLLAFARDARNEMNERIEARLGATTGRRVTVSTFHALGMKIIGEVQGKRPPLSNTAENQKGLLKMLEDIIADLFTDSKLSTVLREWFQGEFAPYKSEHEFKCWGEYYDYIRKFDIRSLQGKTVRSFEECEIANFLYLNGIEYKYEPSYAYDTATSEKRRYKPDFYLPENDIYIEHFGIDANGRTASFVNQEQYLKDMEWKRELHIKHETTLIETYSYEHADGNLLHNLRSKLAAMRVAFSPVPQDKVFEILQTQDQISPFTRLTTTFLQHFKGSRLSLSDVTQRARKSGNPSRALAFVSIFSQILKRYQKILANAGEIDFHDMINLATDMIESGRFNSPFKYILVDEFQDISQSRAALLKALLNSSPVARLFAVGDDWQAIYRFAGSDIAVMQEFGKQFGDYERTNLETTFRCSSHIAEVATEFILHNPAQIPKTVRAWKQAKRPAVQIGLPSDKSLSLFKEALDRIADDARGHAGMSDVLILGRYKHLRPRQMKQLERRYPNLSFSWRTIHGAKGLEADYTVVLGLGAGKYGFPSEIDDDPLLNLVLAAPDTHPNAEERRLLYVALTRARRQVFLLAEGNAPSSFVHELTGQGYDVGIFGRASEGEVSCPRCGTGKLRSRENADGISFFYGCSNYPLCEHTERACPSCGKGLPVKSNGAWRCRDCAEEIEICPSRGGWLEDKLGKYGKFLGCSNFPECNFTRKLRKQHLKQAATRASNTH